ncbi:MAG: hypothetical protein WA659_04655 [Candidatus Aquirickettsiella sp.]
MATIKEILAAEELEKIAMLLGLKQAALKQYTLQTTKEALQDQIKDLQRLEDEKLAEANNLLTKLNGLTEQDWKDSLDSSNIQNDTSIGNTTYLKNTSPLFLLARFDDPKDKTLLQTVNDVYNKITGKQPECTLYESRDQLENDATLSETIKQELLSKPFSPFILARLEFDSQKQLDTFLKETPNKASSKFNTLAAASPPTASVQQIETEETQQSNSPSPFKMNLTPSIKN